MEFNGFIVLAILWFLFNLLTSGRKKPQLPPPARAPQPPRSPEPRTVRVGVDPTQQEGSRLEQVLRDLQRTLEESTQSPYSTTLPLPPAEEFEERQSLEVEPEIVSLEHEVKREARVRVDRDDEAGEFEARRIQAAALRDSARTQGKPAPAAAKITREVSDHTATRAYTPEQLRHAVVWREILGPPVALRGEEAGKGGSGEV